MFTARAIRTLTPLAAALLLGACGSGSPPKKTFADGPVGKDAYVIDDFSNLSDWYVPPDGSGGGSEAGASDSGGKSDSGSSCKGSGATCSSTCSSSQLCTDAESGTCATFYKLTGSASNKTALVKLAEGFAECWLKDPGENTLCSTLDTCSLTGSLDTTTITNWMCNSAQKSDFSSSGAYDAAYDVCGCGSLNNNNQDWTVTVLPTGKKGTICLSYEYSWYYLDYVKIDYCKNFTP
jgi:hypothetical protein